MKPEDFYFKALLQQHAEPIVISALDKWLTKNHLTIVSTRPSSHDGWISTTEAARLLGGVDRHTLYSYIKQGLSARKIGKSYKFKKADIEEFLNNKK